jgi:hypothetical protein
MEMTKDEMIALLIEDDEDQFFNESEKDALNWFLSLRQDGCLGYENWSDDELFEECSVRNLITKGE